MRQMLFLFTVLVLPPGVCWGNDPLQIRVPVPQSAPQPGGVVSWKLNAEVLYVFDADVPVRALSSPAGMVKIVKESGPIRVRGRFVDSPTTAVETRTYSGKFVYFVEPIPSVSGKAELLIIPSGEPKPDDSDVIRQLLDVNGGVGPVIPPGPVNPPAPTALQIKLQAGFDKDPVTATRFADLKALAGGYRAAARIAQDPAYTTRGAMVPAAQRQMSMALGEGGQPATKLFNLRRAAGDYLNDVVGTDDVAMTPALRDKYVVEYNRIADTMELLK